MANKSNRPEMAANKRSRKSISMSHNEGVLFVSLCVNMYKNRDAMINIDEEGDK